MEAIAAVGLASNVLDFVQTTTKLCTLIKQYSSAAGTPGEVVVISNRLELTLRMVSELDEAKRAKLGHEKLALDICRDEAEKLLQLLEGLKGNSVNESSERAGKFSLMRKIRAVEKGWKAYSSLRGGQKLQKLQTSLDRIIDLVMLQQQSRIEATALHTKEKAVTVAQNSELILKGVRELQLGSKQLPSLETVQHNNTLSIFMVPLGRNPGFLGRDDIMAELDLRLGHVDLPSQKQVRKAALCGLGGIGKSQIALEYAYRRKLKVPECSIFWVYAGIIVRFEESYKRIAREFGLPERDDPLVDVLQLVRDFLEHQCNMSWLMIVDNVDDSQIFRNMRTGKSPFEYIPQVANGSVLYTSRNRDVAVDLAGDPITVPPMSGQEARMLLGDRTRGISTEAEQDALIAELDQLPLAITQAASYMNKRRKTIPQYLKLLQHGEPSRLKLLAHDFLGVGRETAPYNSVTMTWFISFQQIKSESPRAADLLSLMSFLDRQSMPASLLVAGNENPVDFGEAIGILEAFSFVSADETGTTYSMHRLVQAATRAWLADQGDGTSEAIASHAIRMLSSRFPDGKFENWPTCARYLPHAESVLTRSYQDASKADDLARAKLLGAIAKYFGKQAKYSLAKSKAKESLDVYQTIGEPKCAEALQVKTEFATIIEKAGDLDGAITLYRENLKDQENLLGGDHLDTLETVGRLALALTDLVMFTHEYEEAELLARRALVGTERAVPANHPKILANIHTLGWCLYRQAKYSEAEILFRECKTQRETVLGESHPDTSSTTNSLALALNRANKIEEAERLLRHSSRVTSMLCGDEHIDAIINSSNLSRFLIDVEKYEEAEIIQRDQLALSEKVLGYNHEITTWCVQNLAFALCRQEKYEQAESLLREQLLIRGQVPEADLADVPSISILTIMTELSNVFYDLGKYKEALFLLKKMLVGWRKVVGDNHPGTLNTLQDLGKACEELKDFKESEKHYRQVMETRRSLLGDDNKLVLQSAHRLGKVLKQQESDEKRKEAEEILRQVVSKREIVLGKFHKDTLASASALGHTLLKRKCYQEAETWFRRVLTGTEETLGESHKSTLYARDDLEDVLCEQRKWPELVESCRYSLALRRKLGPENDDTLRIAAYLGGALMNIGNGEGVALLDEVILKAQGFHSTYREQGNLKEAVLAKEREYGTSIIRFGLRGPQTMEVLKTLALMHDETGKYDAADYAFGFLIDDMEATWGSHDRRSLDLKAEFAQLLDKQGKHDKAAQLRKQS